MQWGHIKNFFRLKKVSFPISFVGLLLVVYSLLRTIYYFYNLSHFENQSFSEIFYSFALGLRFDLSTVLLLNIPIVLMLFVPEGVFRIKLFRYPVFLWGLIANALYIGFNLVDTELVNYTGRRMSMEIFSLGQDIQTEAFDSIFGFWHLSLFTLVFWIVLYKFLEKSLFSEEDWKIPYVPIGYVAALKVPLVILIVIGARGGLQLKPVNVVTAYTQPTVELAQLSLNSTFTLIKSRKVTALTDFDWVKSDEIPSQDRYGRNAKLPVRNVVIILLESFALEYMGAANEGKGYTPFLDELAEKSLFLKNGFANGRKSIEAIPSLFCSLPSLMSEVFITSQYQSNDIHCLTQDLETIGMKSYFFHGAKNGTMYFDSFSKRIGFDHYFGLDQYPNRGEFDGVWGVYDEPYLQYVAKQLDIRSSQRFLSLVFTLSSHHPYKIPKTYEGKFPKGTLEIHESVGYADFALKRFFETIETKDWYKDTLFIVTADHTQKSDQKKYHDAMGRYRVPFLFYSPNTEVMKRLQEVDNNVVFQHIDLDPTLRNILGVQNETYTIFGRSLFVEGNGEAYNGDDEYYWWQNGDYFVDVKAGSVIGGFKLLNGWGPLKKTEVPYYIKNRALSIKQIYNKNMKSNKLYFSD